MPNRAALVAEGAQLPPPKRGLVKEITDAVVKNFKVKPEAVMVQIVESPKDFKAKGGFLFSDKPPA